MDIKSFGPDILYPVALAIMTFSMGLTLKVGDFISIITEPKADYAQKNQALTGVQKIWLT